MPLRVMFDKIAEKLNPFNWLFPHHYKRVILHKALNLGDKTEKTVKKIEALSRRGRDPSKYIREYETEVTEEMLRLFDSVRVTVIEFDKAIEIMKKLEEGVHGKYYIRDRDVILQMKQAIDRSRGRFNELLNRAANIRTYPYRPLPAVKGGASPTSIRKAEVELQKQQRELDEKKKQLQMAKKVA